MSTTVTPEPTTTKPQTMPLEEAKRLVGLASAPQDAVQDLDWKGSNTLKNEMWDVYNRLNRGELLVPKEVGKGRKKAEREQLRQDAQLKLLKALRIVATAAKVHCTRLGGPKCGKCNGTGKTIYRMQGGQCFKCGGKGWLSAEDMQRNRAFRERREREAKENEVAVASLQDLFLDD